jgi:flagellar biosynthesis protein FlhG
MKSPEVWVVAGGKGGTGKTFLTTSMGIYLSRKEKRVILIDMDIGGANLHSFLGISRARKTLSSFFDEKIPLQEIVEQTGYPNLQLITGDIYALASDDIKYAQKKKLLRHIIKLDADYVIMDVGGGSHRNSIDTFLAADKMIVVIDPEEISIENLYHFIKNTMFRKMRILLKAYGFKEIVRYVWNRRAVSKITTIRELMDYLLEFPEIGAILERELADFSINLILNKARDREDILLGYSVKSALIKHLGIRTKYAGFIEHDDSIWRSVRNKRPFMMDYRASRCAKEIETIVDNLTEGKELRMIAG